MNFLELLENINKIKCLSDLDISKEVMNIGSKDKLYEKREAILQINNIPGEEQRREVN